MHRCLHPRTSRPIVLLAFLVLAAAGWTGCAQTEADRGGIAVMTYNVHWDAPRFDETLAIIEQEAPEILCFQELTPEFAEAFTHRFADRYPYLALRPRPENRGIGIASRYPLSRVRVFQDTPEERPALDAVVRTGDAELVVVSLHLVPPWNGPISGLGWLRAPWESGPLRFTEVERLVRRYESEPRPIVILGDMNEIPAGDAIRYLAENGYADACRERDARCGGTWPNIASWMAPLIRIDQIHGRGVAFRNAHPVTGGDSDHRAMVARVIVPAQSASGSSGTPRPDGPEDPRPPASGGSGR